MMTPEDWAHGWTEGDLARRIHRRRDALGLSQEQLATRAQLDPLYLDRVERRPGVPSLEVLIRLADALDTTVADLLGSQPEAPSGRGRAAIRPVLETMDENECLRQLAAGGVGRIAFEQDGRLTVLPVNYALHEGSVVVRTGAATVIARYAAGPVAFEVDRIDEGGHEGWSVLVSSRARLADEVEAAYLRSAAPVEPWAGGQRDVCLVIDPEQVSGRRVRAW